MLEVNAVDVLFCNCAHSEVIPKDRKRRILEELEAAAVNLVAVSDLCGLAAERAALLADLSKRPALKIVACHPRAVRWLFHRGGAPLPATGAEILDMRARSADDILSSLALVPRVGSPAPASSSVSPDTRRNDWIPWFPVIDYDRCTNCKQCLEFCLFGVYETGSEGKVTVASPANCKTNCPACARICPQTAIVFPKVDDSPINGAEIGDEALAHANAKINLDRHLGGDVYAALALRKAKRKAQLLKKPDHSVP